MNPSENIPFKTEEQTLRTSRWLHMPTAAHGFSPQDRALFPLSSARIWLSTHSAMAAEPSFELGLHWCPTGSKKGLSCPKKSNSLKLTPGSPVQLLDTKWKFNLRLPL